MFVSFSDWSIPPMNLARPFSGIALTTLILVSWLATPQSAKAEDLVDFLWGGGAEFGGGRGVVTFDPQYKANQIIVSFADRRLYLITKPGQAITYPVAVPMGEARWQGVTFISDKKINPAWTPTPEMMRQNPRLPRWVPGGHPMNPLGVRAMYLGSSAYRIHGTDAPWTIGQAVSHGCIRMINEDVLDLYPRVPVGTRVTVTWQRFSTSAVASNADYSSASVSSSSGASSSATSDAPAASTGKHRPADSSIGSTFSFLEDEPAAAPPATPPAKKKYSSASSTVKKTSASSTAPAANKASSTGKSSTEKPTTEKSTDATPATTPTATKASASADDALPVQKASAEAQ
jgi:hypothetical protein